MAKQLNLKEIIRLLEDDEAVQKVIEGHEKADETYKGGKRKATTYEGTRDELAGYIKHHRRTVDKTELPDFKAETEAHNFLVAYGKQILGDQNADDEKAIKEVIKLAKKGKLSDIRRAYKNLQRDQDERAYGEHIVQRHVPRFDHKARAGLAKDYIQGNKGLFDDDEFKRLDGLPPDALAYKVNDLLNQHRARRAEYKANVQQQKQTA